MSRDVREYAVEARASQGSRELIAEGVDVHSGEKISFVITNAKAKKGLDELHTTHDNLMFEACCCSFQFHLQVGPEEFARLYNLAQAISAPLLAVAANSPLLIGHRLWREIRVALFQHSTDERSSARQARSHPSRVSFGEGWIRDSVIEIFREEIARFRVILTKQIEEDPFELIARGEAPKLSALTF